MLFNTDVCRARPLLGTLVEIRARGRNGATLNDAIDAAFESVERVHRLMGIQSPESDIRNINESAHRHPIAVHPWTHEVLKCAKHLSEKTGGAFDITVGERLAEWGYFPELSSFHRSEGNWSSIEVLPHNEIRFRTPLTVDLGGIAKGFAVDKAVEALCSAGVESGYVNAGGDIRAIASERVHLRDSAGRVLEFLELSGDAVASSSPAGSFRTAGQEQVSGIVDGQTRQPILASATISVRAPTCMIADGLTKLLFSSRSDISEILAEFSATAYKCEDGVFSILSPHGFVQS